MYSFFLSSFFYKILLFVKLICHYFLRIITSSDKNITKSIKEPTEIWKIEITSENLAKLLFLISSQSSR